MSRRRLFELIEAQDARVLKNMLESKELDLDDAVIDETGNFQVTPLMYAARLGDVETCRVLLEFGADPDASDDSGVNPLHLAVLQGHTDIVGVLLDAGADPEARTEQGAASVHLAAAIGSMPVLEVLRDHDVDMLMHDAQQMNPVDYALAAGHDAVADFLRDHYLTFVFTKISELREQTAQIVGQMGEAKNNLEEREEQEREEQERAEVLDDLPEGAEDYDPDEHAHETMQRIRMVRDPVTPEQWREHVQAHRAYLASGGDAWPGVWQSLVQSGVTFGIYDGPDYEKGAPLDLHVVTLDPSVNANGADLRMAHLVGVGAEHIDFEGANLTRAFVTDADCEGASFRGADLTRADFSRSNLRGADFRHADLSFTDFEHCDLRNADFRGATLRGTKFSGANLSGAKR